MEYDLLTRYIGLLDDPGDWVESISFQDKYKTVPYVGYTKVAYDFIDDVYTTAEKYPVLRRYSDVLLEKGITWSEESMHSASIDDLDTLTILALLIGIVRADRFSEGVLLKFLKDKTIEKWLIKLKELDIA